MSDIAAEVDAALNQLRSEPTTHRPAPVVPLCDQPGDPSDPMDTAPTWAAARNIVLHRDGYKCHRCGGQANEADHLWPKSMGGPDRLSNLAAICRKCNAKKGDALFYIHITADRAEAASDYYFHEAISAVRSAARWLTAASLLADQPERLNVDEMEALMPSEGSPGDLRSVVEYLVSQAEVEL